MQEFVLFKNENESLERIRGKLYSSEEDFIVREINKEGKFNGINFTKLNTPKRPIKKFVKCILVKRGISTFEAIFELSKILNISSKEIQYHGLKDTFGLTSQEISFPSTPFLKKITILKKLESPFFLKDAVFTDVPCELRDIAGNNFIIRIRDVEKFSKQFLSRITKTKFPNFYGHQRFGVRQNNHILGKYLLKKQFREVIKLFLTDSKNEENEIKKVRDNLLEYFGKWKKCNEVVSKSNQLNEEKKVISFLLKNPQDFRRAFNQTGLTQFCINSYSSYLFNLVLKKILSLDLPFKTLPMIGYETKFNNKKVKDLYFSFLKKDGINLKDFFCKDQKELSYAGRIKEAFYLVKDFKYQKKGKDLILQFSLPMGVYANLFLNKIIQNKNNGEKLN